MAPDEYLKAAPARSSNSELRRTTSSTGSHAELPVAVVERVAEKYFPERNRLTGDSFQSAPHQLAYFGIDTEYKLNEPLEEQIHEVLAQDAALAKENLLPFREQRDAESYGAACTEIKKMIDATIERVEGGVFSSWSGLLGIALRRRFGKAATDAYADKDILGLSRKEQ